MKIRERVQTQEDWILWDKAVFSKNTKGRRYYEKECDIRTPFQRDRDRIIHSKAFRRLKHKTQVFISPEGDHYRTRLTHTLEVAQISRTVAKALSLNEDLTEAIALGHDLGHTPFGHAGEEVLDEILAGGFKHNEQSLRVVDVLENDEDYDRKGLNLNFEVRDGIKNHSGGFKPATLEGKVVKICDRVAYINHDIEDAIRGGIISEKDLPEKDFPLPSRERINMMVVDLIEESRKKEDICMSTEMNKLTEELREFLFENVYIGSKAKDEESKAKKIIKTLFDYFMTNENSLPSSLRSRRWEDDLERVVCDYLAGMTDRYIIGLYKELFVPSPWKFRKEE
ncbi:deoxyguanosinetriphosphate triphosphohydrolase [Natranaerofaba carboxydovora]|uniref:deoxyguanosinetriphosphate triphosphohydrolase n=1 Tax=Natranaerofaba carboxydovora TaxID=2742683 RepID=UPI001F12E525|nr:deoxyguanosinetriphosphate triphosphohydrolase [Natranaerofaba carboxydovora]UMZ73100.1 Deoxyguanosinetriphosphate triphosphohydrolase-like protein [Natranaerofaba carboxydovora]